MPEPRAASAGRPDVFVLPTYAIGQIQNARRSAELAAAHGFTPMIVCNSAIAAEMLADDPYALSAASNTGYGGAGALAAAKVEFDAIVLCNDDLVFTDAAMAALRAAVGRLGDDGGAIMGFLPCDRPRIVPLPRVPGVIALVSGLSAVSRRRAEKRARRYYDADRTSTDDVVQPLLEGLGFPFVCVAVTRAAWDRLGGFDARFPLYFEDSDLLARAYLDGAVRVSVALGDCTHADSATARTVLPYIVPLMAVGARNYLQIHRRLRRSGAVVLVTVALVIRAACWAPFRHDRRMEFEAILRAMVATWSTRPPRMPPW